MTICDVTVSCVDKLSVTRKR